MYAGDWTGQMTNMADSQKKMTVSTKLFAHLDCLEDCCICKTRPVNRLWCVILISSVIRTDTVRHSPYVFWKSCKTSSLHGPLPPHMWMCAQTSNSHLSQHAVPRTEAATWEVLSSMNLLYKMTEFCGPGGGFGWWVGACGVPAICISLWLTRWVRLFKITGVTA